jgi:D-mannonate dehydratase
VGRLVLVDEVCPYTASALGKQWDGLTNPYDKQSMGVFAEATADKYKFTREEQDAFALRSHQRALAAIDAGRFADEITPLTYRVVVPANGNGKHDDPPVPVLRRQPRLVYQPDLYQRLIDLHPSPSNALEFCLGSIAEMTEGDVYEATDRYSRQGKLAYVHFRNVRGKVPTYKEAFVDDGDIDMIRVLRILKANAYDGVLIPDHTPQMSCSAPWHAGMAYALGYLRAGIQVVEEGR